MCQVKTEISLPKPNPPGLIRSNNVGVNRKFKNREHMSRNFEKTNKFDPYSIYDDDMDEPTHFFVVPGKKVELVEFQKSFTRMNMNKFCIQKGTTSGQKSTTHLSTDFFPPSMGEYCMLSADAKIENKNEQNSQSLLNTLNNNNNNSHIGASTENSIKKENLERFASKLVNSNHQCFDTSSDSFVEFEGTKTRAKLKKSKKSKRINDAIDFCTCMLCLRSVSYHVTSDDTDEFIEPCSCTGSSTKSTFSRWLCMGVLAVFCPCLMCYLPAKLCQKSVERCSKTFLDSSLDEDDSYKIRFVKEGQNKDIKTSPL